MTEKYISWWKEANDYNVGIEMWVIVCHYFSLSFSMMLKHCGNYKAGEV